MMTELSARLGYIAGIIDGEGCVTFPEVKPNTYSPRLTIGITRPEIPDLFKALFDGNTYIRVLPPPKRTLYLWESNSKPILENIFTQTLPYLIIKKEHALLCLDFIKKFPKGTACDSDTGFVYHTVARTLNGSFGEDRRGAVANALTEGMT